MKILYLHQYYNTPKMSGGTRSFEMARRLVAEGHEVHVVTSLRDEERSSSEWLHSSEEGVNVHWLPVPYSNKMNYFARIRAFVRFAARSRAKLINLGGDLIFATSTPLTVAIPGVLASKQMNIPMVFEVRDLWPELPIAIGALRSPLSKILAKSLERWAYKNSSAIVALSPGMKKGVVDSGFPSNRIAVIPNSCDLTLFAPREINSKITGTNDRDFGAAPLLLYAGTLGKINGVGYLIDLAISLKALNSPVKVLVVGDGSERVDLVNEAAKLGVLGKNIFFKYRIPKADVPALFHRASMACTLFIDLPEMRANSANKFFDTLASNTPVFINYGGWMHDMVVKHEMGISGWRRSVQDAAKDIDMKMSNRDWLIKAGNNAFTIGNRFFNRDQLASQLSQVFQLVLDGNNEQVESIAPGNYH
ncbi:glycosyltransferase family 4 protein [Burkholderiaceae bacterium]|nr:glycosyltransferase family 4 protein [Burkholderiaceae bacterium]